MSTITINDLLTTTEPDDLLAVREDLTAPAVGADSDATIVSTSDEDGAIIVTNQRGDALTARQAIARIDERLGIDGYEDAGCFDPASSLELRRAGVTPDQAARRVEHADQECTIGYWVANGDMTAPEAVEIATYGHQPQDPELGEVGAELMAEAYREDR